MPSVASRISLQDPGGNYLDVRSVSFTESINRGWSWSAVLNEPPPLDAYLEDATWTLSVVASGVTKTLPPLIVQPASREVVGGVGGTLEGIDLISYRLTRSTHIIPNTWQNTDTDFIIEDIASNINMLGSVTGYTGFNIPVFEEEVGQRINYLSVLDRICAVVGYEWRAVAGGAVGQLQFYPLEINPADPGGTQPDWTRVTQHRDPTNRITQLKFIKTSRMGAKLEDGQLSFQAAAAGDVFALGQTLHSAQASSFVSGNVSPSELPDLYDGDPNLGGTFLGKGVAFNAGDVTHVKANRAGAITVAGTKKTSVPAGVELAFEHLHDSGISPPRPADEPWVESLWPNKQYVLDRAQTYMWARNRDTHRYAWSGPPALGLGMGSFMKWPGEPNSRAESITHNLGDGQANTSVMSAVLASDQW